MGATFKIHNVFMEESTFDLHDLSNPDEFARLMRALDDSWDCLTETEQAAAVRRMRCEISNYSPDVGLELGNRGIAFTRKLADEVGVLGIIELVGEWAKNLDRAPLHRALDNTI